MDSLGSANAENQPCFVSDFFFFVPLVFQVGHLSVLVMNSLYERGANKLKRCVITNHHDDDLFWLLIFLTIPITSFPFGQILSASKHKL